MIIIIVYILFYFWESNGDCEKKKRGKSNTNPIEKFI